VAKDKAKALEWYIKSSHGGNIEAPNFVAILYDTGEGIERDVIAAHAWWSIGERRGDQAPRNNLEFLEQKMTEAQIAEAKKLAAKLEAEMAPKDDDE